MKSNHRSVKPGLGVLFRALDIKLHRGRCVEALPGSLPDDPDRLSRFQHEAQVLAGPGPVAAPSRYSGHLPFFGPVCFFTRVSFSADLDLPPVRSRYRRNA